MAKFRKYGKRRSFRRKRSFRRTYKTTKNLRTKIKKVVSRMSETKMSENSYTTDLAQSYGLTYTAGAIPGGTSAFLNTVLYHSPIFGTFSQGTDGDNQTFANANPVFGARIGDYIRPISFVINFKFELPPLKWKGLLPLIPTSDYTPAFRHNLTYRIVCFRPGPLVTWAEAMSHISFRFQSGTTQLLNDRNLNIPINKDLVKIKFSKTYTISDDMKIRYHTFRLKLPVIKFPQEATTILPSGTPMNQYMFAIILQDYGIYSSPAVYQTCYPIYSFHSVLKYKDD